ncbi:MAG: glycosyltransferase family 4 protein [Bacteroidales bacterium]|nr:glycosyltransferase family 4 protein [Bacteroidales bacterium]
MRIAINTRLLLPHRLDGIGWFTAETTRRIVQSHPEHQFYLLFDRRPSPEFLYASNVVPVVLCPQARHPLLWQLYFEVATPWALKHHHIDLYLSPDGMMPLHTGVPTLSVIHDLNFEHATDNLRPSHQRYMKYFFPRFARKASRVATVSEYSKCDIAATYGVPLDKIDVVYDGAHEAYHPLSEAEKEHVRSKYTEGHPYLIFISTILRRKNLANLLLAFDRVKDADQRSLKLVVAGSRAWWGEELATAYGQMQHKEDVVFVGRQETQELSSLLAASEMLVYPSLFEGFGIPILEAMHAEVPVICSSTTSMPEVGGDAARYINPHSPEDIAQAIMELQDAAMRDALVEKGRKQRTLFSWDKTADLLWESLMHAYSDR